jgi:hypothetical protein
MGAARAIPEDIKREPIEADLARGLYFLFQVQALPVGGVALHRRWNRALSQQSAIGTVWSGGIHCGILAERG